MIKLFRYFDDILALTSDGFGMYIKGVYAVKLTLNKVYHNNEHCPFLDLDIYIYLMGNLILKFTIRNTICFFGNF